MRNSIRNSMHNSIRNSIRNNILNSMRNNIRNTPHNSVICNTNKYQQSAQYIAQYTLNIYSKKQK